MTPLRTSWPASLPSPKALQTATKALSGCYVLPETMLQPVVAEQARELALLLSAYSLVSTGPPLSVAQSGMAGDTGGTLQPTIQTLDPCAAPANMSLEMPPPMQWRLRQTQLNSAGAVRRPPETDA